MIKITRPINTTWEVFMATIEDDNLRAAIECYIAIWYPFHNSETTIEVSQFTQTAQIEDSEEEIERVRYA